MNNFKEIAPEAMRKNPFHMIGKDWMLITAGDENKVNTMTASWGGMGVMYGKNVAYILVRPQRYTLEFLDREETFSLCIFDKEYRKMLNYLGSVSGRNEDKIAHAGLTVVRSDNTPFFDEANQIFICKKLVRQPMSDDALLDKQMDSTWYSNKDYHILYIAEITKVLQVTR